MLLFQFKQEISMLFIRNYNQNYKISNYKVIVEI